jgi:hypothetical protein
MKDWMKERMEFSRRYQENQKKQMKQYRVVVASYATEIVEAEDEASACEIAMEIFEPSGEWLIAEVEENE